MPYPLPSPLPYTTYRRVFRYPFLFFTLQATARKPFGSRFCLDWQSRWGAVIGYLVLAPFLDDNVFGIIFGMIAGIMVFISLDELLPAAEEYGKHHHAIYGLVVGMAVMALSLLMLG